MKGMRLSVLTGLVGRFDFGCKRAAMILSFDFDLCSLCPACRRQYLLISIYSMRRDSQHYAGQNCRSDARSHRCRTREAKGRRSALTISNNVFIMMHRIVSPQCHTLVITAMITSS